MKSRDKTAIEERLEDLMLRAMDYEGAVYWNLSEIAATIWKSGGIATEAQLALIQKNEIELNEAEAKAQAMSAADAHLVADAAAAHALPVAINEKTQKALNSFGTTVSEAVGLGIQQCGLISQRELNLVIDLFCKKVMGTYSEAINKNEVLLPGSLEILKDLYHIDNGNVSEVLLKLCVALQGGLPHMDDHY